MKLADLKLNPDNPRNIKEEKLDKLAQSIKDFPKMMVKRPIVYDENKVIIGGNMRYRAIQKLGMDEIPDDWTSDASDFTPEERHRFIMQDNAEMGEHDWDMVANQYELDDLEAWGIDVPYADVAEEVEEDEAPEVSSEPPKSKLGEIYQLGRHRVMCGDSTDKASVELLMDGVKADMVFTDPPYGVKRDKGLGVQQGFRGKGKIIPHREYEGGWDSETPPKECFDLMIEVSDRAIIFGGNYFTDKLPQANHWVVWDKKTKMPTFGDAELMWTNIKRDSVSIIEFEYSGLIGREKERFHPTQKPLGLLAKLLNDYTKENESILDLFLGSGSTLIACEQTDRTCYGMELDPKYVDVIRKRYAKFISPDNTLPENWEELTPAIERELSENNG